MTGSGLPVSLVPSPSDQFEFPPCMIGQRSSLSCILQNICPKLPVNFRFRKLPHFSTEPSSGVIPPGQCRVIVEIELVMFLLIQTKPLMLDNFIFHVFPGSSFIFHCAAARELQGTSEVRCFRFHSEEREQHCRCSWA